MKKEYNYKPRTKWLVFVVLTILMTAYMIAQNDPEKGSLLYQTVIK